MSQQLPGPWIPIGRLRDPVVELPDVGVKPPEELEALVAAVPGMDRQGEPLQLGHSRPG